MAGYKTQERNHERRDPTLSCESKSGGHVPRTRKAFTLLELAVAVALLAMMISFASLIFDMSIDTYRTAMASAEIMQKLQAITGQLNADFKGLRVSPPGMAKISFDTGISDIGGESVEVRSDSIVFFANGDFQSTSQYDDKTVAGNLAMIYYGLANVSTTDPRERVLVRRQTILTSDTVLTEVFDLYGQTEYYRSSLSELIADGFDVNNMMVTWPLNLAEPNDLVTYMAKGVDDFTIQYVGEDESDKDFNEWRPEDSEVIGWPEQLYPSALKFSFTLYDSKGVLEEGKTFTHIVYLGD